MTRLALSSCPLSLSRSRVSCASCCASARPASALGPRFCASSAPRTAASRWRRQVLKEDEYTPSRRIKAPISPDWVQRSAPCRMRRLSALVKLRRRARGTTSVSVRAGPIDGAELPASPVALRAPCNAGNSGKVVAASIAALSESSIFIPTSLLTELSKVGVAGHIGTGGR